ncbi:MAG: tRNA guanosine(15) transglycosylase TgtA [Candidatus Bathyarchaeota archaeon]|nr:MAG: tRNA guanosine(15) transglycosylase TgtA [Candidatus Bathyarchaeota archaeon]
MCFEIRGRDMLARLGSIETKSGKFETPTLLPVINPSIQSINPRTLKTKFGCQALITNAYILKRKGDNHKGKTVHEVLDFDGVIMTDSGAYQILIYGEIDTTPAQIVNYQEHIATDIGTILDVPTNWRCARSYAKKTVDETIERAKQLAAIKTRNDILWVAPIQGGKHLDLVAFSARQSGMLPFQLHALGSPTTVMEEYRFETLVDMILTAKMNMPINRPLHLFGAGHPFMFALAVALGCDMFDSAAYALYARQNRYMTEYGTRRLDKLEYFPCSCPICTKSTPRDVVEMPSGEKQKALAMHNLYASFAELKRIKQSILEGRLWEHLEARSHAHPALLQALKKIRKYERFIEQHSPVTKRSGIFFFGATSLLRPELVRYRERFKERYLPTQENEILLLLPEPSTRPFHNAREIRQLIELIQRRFGEKKQIFHVCICAAPFGVVPLELDDVFPLSQNENVMPPDLQVIQTVAEQTKEYIERASCKKVVLVENVEISEGMISETCKRVKRKGLSITTLAVEKALNDKAQENIVDVLQKLVA